MFGKKNQAPKIESVFLPSKDEKREEEEKRAREYDEAHKQQNVEEEELSEELIDDESADENGTEPSEETSESEGEQIVVDGETLTQEGESEELKELEREKQEQLDSVQSRISRILKNGSVEIVDENAGDIYEFGESSDKERKQQEDYDSLKALFGTEKAKSLEITVVEDEFDYAYVGQYVDELDILHIKNIKHVKLQSKHSKAFKILTAAAVLVAVLVLAIVLPLVLLREKPVYLVSISLNQSEASYFVDEQFVFSGRYIIAKYSDGSSKRVQLSYNMLDRDSTYGSIIYSNGNVIFSSGGTSSVARLAFNYEGMSTVLEVTVKQKQIVGIGATSNELFNTPGTATFIGKDKLVVYVEYEQLGAQELEFSADIQVYVTGADAETYIGGANLTYNESMHSYQNISSGVSSENAVWIVYMGYVLKLQASSDNQYCSTLLN